MDFSKMSIGTKVMSIQLGECEIETIIEHDPIYPILCKGVNDKHCYYTINGYCEEADALPSLTLIEPQLTPEEIFFNEVKGKKIRWSNFSKGEYFIPIELLHDARMKGLNENGEEDYWNIENGFDNLGFKSHWEFYTVPEPKYRPYTYEEACKLLGKGYKLKRDHFTSAINTVQKLDGEIFIDGISSNTFLIAYTWLNGTPCGVEEER